MLFENNELHVWFFLSQQTQCPSFPPYHDAKVCLFVQDLRLLILAEPSSFSKNETTKLD